MTNVLQYEQRGDVAVLTVDDGKANALSHDLITALHGALDQAQADAAAVVFVGRPGRFCAGFDLSVMQGGPDVVRALVKAGAELFVRIYEFPQPVVAACTGHALAAGAIWLMAADLRIGAAGSFKIGLNEVSIGMPVPVFATELARDRLSPRHLGAATVLATIYDPAAAVEVGYLDVVVEPDAVVETAITRADTLAQGLRRGAFATSKANLRTATTTTIRASLDADIAAFTVEQ
jgi:enoyl-CoA hydratase